MLRRPQRYETTPLTAYWPAGTPHDEEGCRDRLVEHLGGRAMPAGVRMITERRTPRDKYADVALACGDLQLPIEVKGQWHRDLWNAASTQLDRQYAADYRAHGRGLYLVLWFGAEVPRNKRLRRHPDGCDPPTTPAALRTMLVERIPAPRRAAIDVVVLDLSLNDADAT